MVKHNNGTYIFKNRVNKVLVINHPLHVMLYMYNFSN